MSDRKMDAAKKAMLDLGMGDFFNMVDSISTSMETIDAVAKWKNTPLTSSFLYSLHCESEVELIHTLSPLESKSKVLFSTLPGSPVLEGIEHQYSVENISVIQELVDAHVRNGDTCFIISPAFALQASQDGAPLSHALEELKRYFARHSSAGVICIIVDMDMAEGKSDARRVIHRMTQKTLK
jgi:hypothetical protein